MMYQFLKNMWIMQRVNAQQIQAFVPKYITETQADEITSEQQIGVNDEHTDT